MECSRKTRLFGSQLLIESYGFNPSCTRKTVLGAVMVQWDCHLPKAYPEMSVLEMVDVNGAMDYKQCERM